MFSFANVVFIPFTITSYLREFSCLSLMINENSRIVSSSGIIGIRNFIISKEAQEYTPYWETTKPIASIIEKYFPNKMKSAGSDYDYFDLERGFAIQSVEVVDMATLRFNVSTKIYNLYRFESAGGQLPNIKAPTQANMPNAITDKFTITPYQDSNAVDYGLSVRATKVIRLTFNDVSTIDELTPIINGALLYCALETPIETPIDQEDLEALRTLQVEVGGTLTFEQLNTFIEVPNKETMLVKVV